MFNSISELIKKSQLDKKEIWEIIMEEEANENGVDSQVIYNKMLNMWYAMKKSAENYDGNLKSSSGLSGGDGEKMREYKEKAVCGSFIADVIEQALCVAECNACMKCIVAAPTAGSCGVLPAVLLPYVKKYNVDEDTITKALFHASAFGQVIATRAFISGAEGGCQAEISISKRWHKQTICLCYVLCFKKSFRLSMRSGCWTC